MDIQELKQGLSSAKVDNAPEEIEEGGFDTIIDNIEINQDHNESEQQEEEEFGEFGSEEELLSYFSGELGYTGDIEGVGVSALLHIAKQRLEESDKIVNDARVKEFLEHISKGGDIKTYEQSQPSSLYSDITLDEADTDFTEKIVRECLIVLRNFDDEDDVVEYITSLKDEDKLFAFAEKNLPKLQRKEFDNNVEKKAAIDRQLEETRNEAVSYYKQLSSAFDNNLIPGVVIEKKHLSEIKRLSTPDRNNRIGIQEILDDMPTDHIATMNTLAWCLKNGQSFEFKPGAGKRVEKPIHQILNKGKSIATSNRTLASVINSKMNNK